MTVPYQGLRRPIKDMLPEDPRDDIRIYKVTLGKEYPQPETLLTFYGVGVLSKGGISLVQAKKKSGKSYFCTWMMACLASPGYAASTGIAERHRHTRTDVIVYIDTEQEEPRTQRVLSRITQIVGGDVDVRETVHAYNVRSLHAKDRMDVVRKAIDRHKPSVVVIDGIRDMVRNINSEEESTDVMDQLLALSTNPKCHIVCVLHENKGSDHARGHLGTELGNKAETVFRVRATDQDGAFAVESEATRDGNFEPFTLLYGANGLPLVRAGVPVSHADGKRDRTAERRRKIIELFADGKTQQEIASTLGIGQATVSRCINDHKQMALNQFDK
jgi:archaellum biogenesis ATPase FlaH